MKPISMIMIFNVHPYTPEYKAADMVTVQYTINIDTVPYEIPCYIPSPLYLVTEIEIQDSRILLA